MKKVDKIVLHGVILEALEKTRSGRVPDSVETAKKLFEVSGGLGSVCTYSSVKGFGFSDFEKRGSELRKIFVPGSDVGKLFHTVFLMEGLVYCCLVPGNCVGFSLYDKAISSLNSGFSVFLTYDEVGA